MTLVVEETNPDQEAFMCFRPVPIGTIENINGHDMKVVDNTQTYIVTYERLDV